MVQRRYGSLRILLAVAVGVLLAASVTALFFDDGGAPRTVTSLRGAEVELYGGNGIYRHDSVTKAVMFRGFDLTNLFVDVPLGLLALLLLGRGGFRGLMLAAALFAYLAYNYLIGAMGNAFNPMFLVWTALFSLGLAGLVLVLSKLEHSVIPEKINALFPRRWLALYLILLGLFLLLQYGTEIVSAYIAGSPPASLEIYTTLELAALELGIMIPLHLAAGILLWKRRPLGYLLGIILLFTAMMTFIALSTAFTLLLFDYGRAQVVDVVIPLSLALIASAFSGIVSRRISN